MSDRVFVKPAPGLKVKMGDGRWLPDEGALAPNDVFLTRRLKTGDVVLAEAPAEPKPSPAPRKEAGA